MSLSCNDFLPCYWNVSVKGNVGLELNILTAMRWTARIFCVYKKNEAYIAVL